MKFVMVKEKAQTDIYGNGLSKKRISYQETINRLTRDFFICLFTLWNKCDII